MERFTLAWLLVPTLALGACGPSVHVRMAAERPAIARLAAEAAPPRWRIPLGASVVEDLQAIGGDALYLALRNDNAELTAADLMLVDRRRGEVLWRHDRAALPGEYTLLGEAGGHLLLRVDGADATTLLSLHRDTGERRWQQRFEGGLERQHLLAGAVVVAQATAQELRLWALSLADGRELWAREHPAPATASATLADAESVWVLGDGIERLRGFDGNTLWRRAGIALAAGGPPPQRFDGTLHLLDKAHALRSLSAASGEDVGRARIDPQYRITNIYPTGERIYLRGRRVSSADGPGALQARLEATVRQSVRNALGSGTAAPDNHVLLAVSRDRGTTDWVHNTGEPSVSNIIELEDRLFHATASRLVCLDRVTGELRFARLVTNAGENYPVRIRPAGGHIVYLGEWMVAAFDPDTGQPAYRHGMNPVPDGSASLSGLDRAIARLQSRLGRDTPTSRGIATSLGQTASRLQNSANSYHAKANFYFGQSQVAATPGRRSDLFYRSVQARNSAQIESAFSGAYRSMAMTMAIWDLNAALEQAARQAALESEIAHARLYRKALLNGFPEAEGPRHVYRPHNSLRDFVGVAVVNLESGARKDVMLSPQYQDYGIWNHVDAEQGVIYHHGIGLDTTAHRSLPQRRGLSTFHILESFLLARPFDAP